MKYAELVTPSVSRTLSKAAEALLEDLAAMLEIPASRYEAAERSYQSVGKWLDRPGSIFANVETSIYPQGSFRLGTAIPPVHGEDDFDLDVVCEVGLPKALQSQAEFKQQLGAELVAYAKAHSMQPPVEARRCWTLIYADGAQFHMDVLPAVPDGIRQRALLEAAGMRHDWAELSVAITDNEVAHYHVRSSDWPASNPKGYCEWFKGRMRQVFDARRAAMKLEEARASIEDIPEYRVKTPLQSAIQILKRHRDVRFVDDSDLRPISIILTTLAAHAYNQETTIGAALFGILDRMHLYIKDKNGVAWIENPTDPRENFADKWAENPAKKEAFFEWLGMARADFEAAAHLNDVQEIIDTLSPRMGRSLMESAATRRRRPAGLLGAIIQPSRKASNKLRRLMDASHKQSVLWPQLARGSVQLNSVKVERRGFRPALEPSDGPAVPKHCSLTFDAQTSVPMPYQVYWQVVNTGDEARQAKSLRGGFDEGVARQGKLTRHESTLYAGSHSIECFIVKDGYCVARSGPFIVNIG